MDESAQPDWPKGLTPPNSRFYWALALGLMVGIAALLRQLFLIFVPFLFLWMIIRGRKRSLVPILISIIVLVVMIAPITVFNDSRFDRFVLLNTNAGYALFWSNHPIYGTHFQPILTSASYVGLIPKELLHLDEAALDQALMRQGLQFILDDPKRFVLLSLSRIPSFFMFWPSPGSGMISNLSRVFSFGLLWPFMLVGIVRGWIKYKPKAMLSLPDIFTHRIRGYLKRSIHPALLGSCPVPITSRCCNGDLCRGIDQGSDWGSNKKTQSGTKTAKS